MADFKTTPRVRKSQESSGGNLTDQESAERGIIDQVVEERDLAISSGGSGFAAKAARLAAKNNLKVEKTYEVSDIYAPAMGTILFMVEGRKEAESPENGEFEGLVVRVIDQELHDDTPASVQLRAKKGTTLLLPVGNKGDDGKYHYGRFDELAKAPEGSVWMIQAPEYVPAAGGAPGAFLKKPTKGGRSFYPYHFARFGTT